MYQFRFVLFCAALAGSLFLAGCGSLDPAQPADMASQRKLPLKYADGLSGGYRIDPVAQTVPKRSTACAMEQPLSASVSQCIDHRQMGELRAQLILPNQTSLDLDLQKAAQVDACLNTGRLFTLSLPTNRLQVYSGLKGDWTVQVCDHDRVSSTPVGYLVGWSMQAGGLR